MKIVTAHYVQMQTIEVPDDCPTDDIQKMWKWLEENKPKEWEAEGEQAFIADEQSRDYEIVDVKQVRYIDCSCGQVEEMLIDEQRDHSQSFKWIKNEGEEGIYECPDCKKLVKSK